jgi:CCR4-NOT transcription complex subunit 7/8
MAPQSAAMQLELLGLRAKEVAHVRTEANQEEFDPLVFAPNTGAEGSREIHEVWAWNLDEEFRKLIEAVTLANQKCEAGVMLGLDMEFPGFVHVESRSSDSSDILNVRYQALRENVDSLRPIQLGAAVASADGVLRGVWTFNLSFDVDVDLHTEQSVAFLRAAGINFPRHAAEGIDAEVLGKKLAESILVGEHESAPCWVTFSGAYDLGYLLKLLTNSQPLPQEPSSFDSVLSVFCPRRHELRDSLPHGSLESLARKHGVSRYGQAHTAGSDALLTLELYLCLKGRARKWSQWSEDPWGTTDAGSPYNMESWYPGWEHGWAATQRWEEQYNPFNFSTPPPGAPWMSQMLSPFGGTVPATYMGQGMQAPLIKGVPNGVWPDAATAAALLKSSGWHSADPAATAVSSQVLAI